MASRESKVKRHGKYPGEPNFEEDPKKFIGTIDAEPSWESLLPVLVRESFHARGDEAKELAYSELQKMARAADAYRVLQKTGRVP